MRAANFRERMQWLAGVLGAPGVTAGAKVVAARLALHANGGDGRCDPAVATVAKGCAMTSRGVEKALAALASEGWLTWDRSPGRASNSYHFELRGGRQTHDNPEPPFGLTPNHGSGVEEPTPNHGSDQSPSNPEPWFGVQPMNPERIDIQPRTKMRPTPNGGSDKYYEYERIERDGGDSPPPVPGEFLGPGDVESYFREFWEQFPKKVGEADARRAFRAAVADGARPQDVVDGAGRYGRETAARESRFIATPANWLRSLRWADAPAEATAPQPGSNDPLEFLNRAYSPEQIAAAFAAAAGAANMEGTFDE